MSVECDLLAEKIAECVCKEIYKAETENSFPVQVKVPLPEINLMKWLESSDSEYKFLFKSKMSEERRAGSGSALVFEDRKNSLKDYIKSIEEYLKTCNFDVYGGFGFDPEAEYNENSCWYDFTERFFFIPRFEIIEESGVRFFVCNVIENDSQNRERIISDIKKMNFTDEVFWEAEPVLKISSFTPEKSEWYTIVRRALYRIRAGKFDKVVLAREAFLKTEQRINHFLLADILFRNSKQRYNYLFVVHGAAFFGSSPELLFRREERKVYTEALAGTSTDRDELSGSVKEIQEHRFVFDMIRDTMSKLCTDVSADEAAHVISLREAFHLRQKISGTLKGGRGDADLVLALHPTPATGGFPVNKALNYIREYEPFERGWYAGAVGRISRMSSELTVALRCALVNNSSVKLYSGAGIVEGSSAESEWEELNLKLSNFLGI